MNQIKPLDVVELLVLDCAYDHAECVQQLIKQRDDLLEALKQLEAEASFATIPIDVERKALNIALSNARAAITKAES